VGPYGFFYFGPYGPKWRRFCAPRFLGDSVVPGIGRTNPKVARHRAAFRTRLRTRLRVQTRGPVRAPLAEVLIVQRPEQRAPLALLFGDFFVLRAVITTFNTGFVVIVVHGDIHDSIVYAT
jgi:hypothetical protein